ncbi:glutamine synthetase family protein [Streptomyces mirabilis]|uniref:glutamine synthetase family protein n=1 Tax=Streptomyces mirabilis TaxID=68239 RepID=UPI00224DD0D5|nr:glutamine synthetase family protein [Streptomyces mirabilis]MCX4429632.1 glutamine synthetase family protein [Streptomyces mirabilis]
MTDKINDRLTRDRLGELVQAHAINTVMLGVPDLMGRLKGKSFDALHFLTQLPAGSEMCAYILASDVNMTPLDGFGLTGWHEGYGDLKVVPDLGAIRRLSYLPGTVLIFGDAHDHNGYRIPVAPREMLRQQINYLVDLGWEVRVGIESEFLLYRGSADRSRRAGYRGLTPVSPHNLDYALDHPPSLSAFFGALRDALHQADAPVEAIKTEGAPGQIEVTWPYGDAMRACDTYTVHKHAVRAIAAQQRMTPTFMAVPETGIGSGLHFHVSLWRDSEPAFETAFGADLPAALGQSIAGLLDALPEMTPLYAPYPNSYRRFAPHSFAPTNFTWGYDNRTCAIRVAGRHKDTRLEVRLPGADANPYLALAAVLAGILHGITKHPMLPDPCTGDAYEADPLTGPVPRTLDDAVAAFAEGALATHAFSPSVVQHCTHATRTEIDAHHGQVTDVDRARGFFHA